VLAAQYTTVTNFVTIHIHCLGSGTRNC